MSTELERSSYDLTCDTCGRSGTADDGIEAGGPCQEPCPGTVRSVSGGKWWEVLPVGAVLACVDAKRGYADFTHGEHLYTVDLFSDEVVS